MAERSSSPPITADPAEVARLLELAAAQPTLSARLDVISQALMGRPYAVGSLVGGPEVPERLVTRLDAFDCVTYCDSVIALATAASFDEFTRRVVALRYRAGRLDWRHRNHYTHRWLARGVRGALLEPLLPQRWASVGETRTLDVLAGYPALRWRPRYLPWSERDALTAVARTGDWLGFVSQRPNLDTFHVGLLVVGDGLWVRHASRSRGRVILEALDSCMEAWDVPGLLVARPLSPPPDPSPGEPS